MEDLQLYGSRPQPLDVNDVDEESRLDSTSLSVSRSATEFQVAVNHPARVCEKTDTKISNYQAVTAFDWNSGSTPLESWLNQSAIPSTSPAFMGEREEDVAMAGNPVAQEIEEIKVFRNVHMNVALEPITEINTNVESDQVAKLELDAQIYYRNIIDRYSELPLYLALRLARANQDRADRLRWYRVVNTASHYSRPLRVIDSPQLQSINSSRGKLRRDQSNASQKKYKCSCCGKRFIRPSSLQTHMYAHTAEKRKKDLSVQFYAFAKFFVAFRCNFQGCERTFSDVSLLRRHRRCHKTYKSVLTASSSEVHINGDENYDTYFGQNLADSNFWTGGHTPSRCGSIDSRSSSMNSSLRGDAAFDPEEQEPNFHDRSSRSSSADFGERSRGLPPPPVELRQNICECDICGDTIMVRRRRDWQ